MRRSLRRDHAEFGHMRAQRIDSHGALANEQVARPVHHQHRLLRIGSLEEENTALREQAAALTAQNRTLKDEIARLKELPRQPPDKPSGMEQSTQAGQTPVKTSRSRRRRGATLPRIAITQEVVLPAAAPAGSRFKGYDDIVVQDLDLRAWATRYRRERWTTPSGETVSAALPAGIVGGFGPDLQRFILALHIQGQVTTERLRRC